MNISAIPDEAELVPKLTNVTEPEKVAPCGMLPGMGGSIQIKSGLPQAMAGNILHNSITVFKYLMIFSSYQSANQRITLLEKNRQQSPTFYTLYP